MFTRESMFALLLTWPLLGQDPPPPEQRPRPRATATAVVEIRVDPQWPGPAGMFAPRGGRTKVGLPTARRAVEQGLAWLVRSQAEDGHWAAPEPVGEDATVVVTGLALLALLGDGNTMRAGPHKGAVKSAVAWLREQQSPQGAFATRTGPHLVATLAFTEAYALSSYRLLQPNVVKAVAHLRTLRHEDGGFRAGPDEVASDPALTLWGVMALATARFAGEPVADGELEAAATWLGGPAATRIVETGILGCPAPARRQPELAFDLKAANAFTWQWLGVPEDLAAAQAEVLRRAAARPREWAVKPGARLGLHEWFCSSHALFQAGDEAAVAAIGHALAAAQLPAGEDTGSWDPIGVWGEVGGRTWTTAMAVLTLETPWRYARGLAGKGADARARER